MFCFCFNTHLISGTLSYWLTTVRSSVSPLWNWMMSSLVDWMMPSAIELTSCEPRESSDLEVSHTTDASVSYPEVLLHTPHCPMMHTLVLEMWHFEGITAEFVFCATSQAFLSPHSCDRIQVPPWHRAHLLHAQLNFLNSFCTCC